MDSKDGVPGVDGRELRERNIPQHAPSTVQAKLAVQELNAEVSEPEKSFKDKRIFGRTPNGTGKSLECPPPLRIDKGIT